MRKGIICGPLPVFCTRQVRLKHLKHACFPGEGTMTTDLLLLHYSRATNEARLTKSSRDFTLCYLKAFEGFPKVESLELEKNSDRLIHESLIK